MAHSTELTPSVNASGVEVHELILMQMRAYKALKKLGSERSVGMKASMVEWLLLGLIAHHGSLRLSEVARALAVEPPLATNIVNALERRELITRSRDTTDHRVRVVKLTDIGAQLLDKINQALGSSVKDFFKGISPKEMGCYLRVLGTISKRAR